MFTIKQKFLFAVMMFSGGLALCIIENNYGEQGPWLMSLAVGIVLGAAKKPGNGVKLLLLSVILCAGCISPTLDKDFISLTRKAFDRHDKYVQEDATLQLLEKEAYFEETAACREYLNAVEQAQTTNYP